MASLVFSFSSCDYCFCRPAAASLLANFSPSLIVSLPHRHGHGHAFIVSTAHKASNLPSPSSFEDDHRPWTVHDSNALYRLHGWGAPYFSINAAGHLCVRPSGSVEDDAGRDDIDVIEVVDALAARQMQLPLILRFPDILRHRMQELQACFSAAMSKFDYQTSMISEEASECLKPDKSSLAKCLEIGHPIQLGDLHLPFHMGHKTIFVQITETKTIFSGVVCKVWVALVSISCMRNWCPNCRSTI